MMDVETTLSTINLGDGVTTSAPDPALPEGILQFVAVCCFSMTIFGTISNTFAIAAFTCSKDLRSPPIALLINLSVSQLLLCWVTLPIRGVFYLRGMHDGIMGERTEKGMAFLNAILYQVMLHTIVAISSTDFFYAYEVLHAYIPYRSTYFRMIAIRFPHAYRNLATWSAAFGALGAIWVSSFLVWLPAIVLYLCGAEEFINPFMMGFSSKKAYLVVLQAIFGNVLPILITAVCYCAILSKVGCCLRTGRDGGQSDPKQTLTTEQVASLQYQPWKDDVIRAVFGVFVILLLCTVPHAVLHFLKSFDVMNLSAWLLIHVLYYIQYVIDPIVYAVMSPRYRRAFAELMKNLSCRELLPAGMTFQDSAGTWSGTKKIETTV